MPWKTCYRFTRSSLWADITAFEITIKPRSYPTSIDEGTTVAIISAMIFVILRVAPRYSQNRFRDWYRNHPCTLRLPTVYMEGTAQKFDPFQFLCMAIRTSWVDTNILIQVYLSKLYRIRDQPDSFVVWCLGACLTSHRGSFLPKGVRLRAALTPSSLESEHSSFPNSIFADNQNDLTVTIYLP